MVKHVRKLPKLEGTEKEKEETGIEFGNNHKILDCGEIYNNEKSLRHIFYLEYRNHAKNPIVYSRYGKAFYDSEEKFDSEAWSNINYCNLKKLIKEKGKSLSAPSLAAPYYTPKDRSDKTLVFESRFESGNLSVAVKSSDNEYDLILQNDVNTKGHTQWYYFRVSNTTKGSTVKFNILNMSKPASLYNNGMKILLYSEKDNDTKQRGWFRGGTSIKYYKNNYRKESMTSAHKFHYTLTFEYKFEHENDTIYFANCYPYTYTDLNDDLNRYQKDIYMSNHFTKNTLGYTLAGNKCEYMTVTSRNNSGATSNNDKKGVFLTARVHPGETNASWMMKGLIEFLLSHCSEACVLREKFIFKIIPMLNPDGVINGNYRCALSGDDLNRRYKNPSRILHPIICETKKLCKNFAKERPMTLYCDFHGHSRKKNVFMYGNRSADNSTKIFPYILSKISPFFSYKDCKFSVQKSKESTARIAMWREFNISNVLTIEASFCGPHIGDLIGFHYSKENLMEIGRSVALGLLIYCDVDIPATLTEIRHKRFERNNKLEIAAQEIEDEKSIYDSHLLTMSKEAILQSFSETQKHLVEDEEESSDSDGGSDTEPSDDNLEANEIEKLMIDNENNKKKLVKRRSTDIRLKTSIRANNNRKKTPAVYVFEEKPPQKKVNKGNEFEVIQQQAQPLYKKIINYNSMLTYKHPDEMQLFEKFKKSLRNPSSSKQGHRKNDISIIKASDNKDELMLTNIHKTTQLLQYENARNNEENRKHGDKSMSCSYRYFNDNQKLFPRSQQVAAERYKRRSSIFEKGVARIEQSKKIISLKNQENPSAKKQQQDENTTLKYPRRFNGVNIDDAASTSTSFYKDNVLQENIKYGFRSNSQIKPLLGNIPQVKADLNSYMTKEYTSLRKDQQKSTRSKSLLQDNLSALGAYIAQKKVKLMRGMIKESME